MRNGKLGVLTCLLACALASTITATAWALDAEESSEVSAACVETANNEKAANTEQANISTNSNAEKHDQPSNPSGPEAPGADSIDLAEETASETLTMAPATLSADDTEACAEADLQPAGIAMEAASTNQGLPNGTYTLYSYVGSPFVLDVAGGSKNNAANVQIYTTNNTDAQKWVLTYTNGYYTIKSVRSGLFLDVSGCRMADGANVQQYKGNNTDAQLWIIEQLSADAYVIRAKKNRNYVLDVSGAAARNGANVQIYRSNNTKAQKWYFAPLGMLTGTKTIEDGVYTVASTLGTVLDISGASYNDGANAQAYSSNSTNAQRWAFTWDNSSKTYSIRNAANGKALDVSGGNTSSGANVQQWAWNGSNAQRWIVESSGSSYTIRSLVSGMALDISGASNKAGANVQAYRPNGTKAQKWNLTKIDMKMGPIANGVYNIYTTLAPIAQSFEVTGSSSAAGTQLQTNASNTTSFAQKFNLARVSENIYTLQAVNSGKYITNSGGKIVQADKSNGSDQRWVIAYDVNGLRLISVADNAKSIEVSGGQAKSGSKLVAATTVSADRQRYRFQAVNLITDGYYLIRNANSNLVLDINGASFSNGANVQQYTGNGTGAQTFYISYSGGFYKIENARSYKALDVKGGAKTAGANVQQWKWNGTGAQLWNALVEPNGAIVFKNKNNQNMVLEVAGNSQANSGNVRQNTYTKGATNQQWLLEPTKQYSISGDTTLDRYIGDILGDHSNLYSAYDYVSRFSYRSGNLIWSGKYLNDATSRSYAKEMVEWGSGNCYRFACLFSWLARGLGYSTNVVTGWVASYSGGQAPHGWVEVYSGGTHVCDPDMFEAMRDLNFYMQTYEGAPISYYFW